MKRAMMFGLSMLFVVATVSFVDAAEKGDRGPRKKGEARKGGDRDGDRKGGEGRRRGHHGELAKKLNLSEEQQASMKKIHETFVADMKAAREAKDRDAAKAAFKTRHESVMGILTAEQKEKLAKLRKEHGPRDGDGPRKGPRKGKGDGDGPRKGGKRPGADK